MRIPLRIIDLDDLSLRAIAHQIGRKRPATDTEVRDWVEKLLDATLADLVAEYTRAIEATKGEERCKGGRRKT